MPLANNFLVQNGADWVVGATPSRTGYGRGVPNPFGPGASSFEPNTEIYDPSNDPLMKGSRLQVEGQSEYDKQAADKAAADAASAASATASAIAGGSGTPGASGSVLNFINAAKSLLGKPYVWGGTTANGVDCSGLLYFAFNQAGIKMPRYRAVDYGRMGQTVSADQARAGDVVYWNESGDVDHVGIYLGNGMVLNSPHSGTVVQINKVWGNPTYHRIINDDGFGQIATSSGGSVQSYGGKPAGQLFMGSMPAGIGIESTAALNEGHADTGFKMRAV